VTTWRNSAPDVPDLDLAGEVVDVDWATASSAEGSTASTGGELASTVMLSAALGSSTLSATFGAALKDQAARTQAWCRCIWVSGLPGCALLDIAAPLAKVLGAALIDLQSVLGLGVDFSAGNVADAALALAEAVRTSASECRLAIICDVHCAPVEVLTKLAAGGPFADACYISHVVTILDPLLSYPWNSARHPLALSRAHRGWVSVVVVQDDRPSEGAAARSWSTLRACLLRELQAGRAGGHVLQRPSTGALIDGPLQDALAGAPRLAVAVPGLVAPTSGSDASCQSCCWPDARLECVFVPVGVPLDIGTLREQCLCCLASAARAAWPAAGERCDSPWHGLACVEARVHGATAAELWTIEPGALRARIGAGDWLPANGLVLSSRGELRPPQHWMAPLATSTGVLLWWCTAAAGARAGRQAEAEALVAACRLQPPGQKPFWTPADVTAEEVARLEAEVRGSELPYGYFSTATGYMDTDGNRHKDHPELQRRLADLVAQRNATVEAHNALALEIAGLPIFQQ